MILKEIYNKIIQVADENYIKPPRLVGGVPRDLYLGLTPNSDIDLTTNDADCPRLGISFAYKHSFDFKMFEDSHVSVYAPGYTTDFSSNFISKEAVGYAKEELEGFDKSLEEVYSRDFTMNTLHQDLLSDNMDDPTGLGFRDLDNKVIRAITSPEICFSDDLRRVFRAINFASRLGFEIDGGIIDYARNNVDLISNEMGRSLRDAYITSVVSESLSEDPEITLGYLLDMNLLSLVPLTGLFKEQLIKRKMVARYLDDSRVSQRQNERM